MASFLESARHLFGWLLKEWGNLHWSALKFGRRDEAVLFGSVLVAVFISALLVRYLNRNKLGRKQIILPAIVSSFNKSGWTFIRHAPALLFFLVLPLFFIALADPYLGFAREEVTYPGRRIAILVDASSSMEAGYNPNKLKTAFQNRFYTSASAARYFVETRMKGPYKDLMALIEFGNESYIITPFTNDYKNILTSISLISEPEERVRFSDTGTFINKALRQSLELFGSFDFLKASGNLIVIISDAEDGDRPADGASRSLDQITRDLIKNKIPVYFIKVNLSDNLFNDEFWKKGVEKTGGKFYSAVNEEIILSAIKDIDRSAVGKIELAKYSSRRPLFGLFLGTAAILWTMACIMVLAFNFFRKFP